MEINEIREILISHKEKMNECKDQHRLYILLSSIQSIMLQLGFLENNPLYQYSQLLKEQLVPDETLPIGIDAAKEDTDLLLQCLILELPIWCSEKTKATEHS